MKKIILASKSPYRKALLERLGVQFQCFDPKYDESEFKEKLNNPKELAEILAKGKALNIYQEIQDAVIIGSDQVCYFDGNILGKSGDIDKSVTQLLNMQGKTHFLYTSYFLKYGDQEITRTNITELKMRKLSESQIRNYVVRDNATDCAGSYKLELGGISLMESIKTEDHTAIIGLPLIQLGTDLLSLGVQLPPE